MQPNPIRLSLICNWCHAPFVLLQSQTGRRRGQFCSRRCSGFAQSEARAKPIADRLWAKIDKSGGCWTWTGAINPQNGYAYIGRGGKYGGMRAIHKVAWEITYGPIPAGLFVCHHCDNRICARPDHLFIGTHSDNMLDASSKGRHPSQVHPDLHWGEANGMAKLTSAQIQEIKRQYDAGGISFEQLARAYGVVKSTIRHAYIGRTWHHLKN